ncbi:Hypothetical protein SMAX5B_012761 [Scophthalmus maximus]|uniref:Uncharacterized protein n=1 Tax=Scophthalmus maximus TaxID=52904 RepID=A0A2U9B1P2_SCOMX|nr:Hypothetical protein SMAX5B_012761 [Scophthalmus maximus]
MRSDSATVQMKCPLDYTKRSSSSKKNPRIALKKPPSKPRTPQPFIQQFNKLLDEESGIICSGLLQWADKAEEGIRPWQLPEIRLETTEFTISSSSQPSVPVHATMATEVRQVERGEEGVAYEAQRAASVGDGAEVGVLAPHPRTWEPKTQLIFM